MLTQMQSKDAHLNNIKADNINCYYEALVKAKEMKAEAVLNRVRIKN